MKTKQVTLPGGGAVTIPDDGRPVELLKFPDGEGIQYADGSRVTFRSVGSNKSAAPATPAKPALTEKQIADGLAAFLKPILKRQTEKIAGLEARIAMLEARLG